MSAGTLGENIPLLGSQVDPQNLPPWLHRMVMLGANVSVVLKQTYQVIHDQEARRIADGFRGGVGHRFGLNDAGTAGNKMKNR